MNGSVNPTLSAGGLGYGAMFRNMETLLSGPLWESYSTMLYPRTLREALYWSNWLKTRFGDYGSAIRRAVSYFMGGVDLVGKSIDIDSREHYTKELVESHDLLANALEVGTDLQFNGNAFVSVLTPITRVLQCPSCGAVQYLENMTRGIDYDFSGGEFTSTCPACHKGGRQNTRTYVSRSATRPLSFVNWNPLNISIDHCTITGAERITWIPEYNDKSFLENTAESTALQSLPDVVLKAVVNDEAILFKGDSCLHIRRDTDAINRSLMRGWGVPSWLAGFKYVILLMLLERQLEAGAKDFILPLRLLFPLPQEKSGSDPLAGSQFSLDLAGLKGQVTNALQAQAVKQASWHMISTPIGSMQMGGDAKAIIPVDVLEYVVGALLNTQCIPIEFGKPSLQIGNSSPPVAFKMFEQTWSFDARQQDKLLAWYLRRCSDLLGWPQMEGSLAKPSVADDPILVQVLQAGMVDRSVSKTTFYRRFNIDPRMEQKRINEEAIEQMKASMELQKAQEELGFTSQSFGVNRQEAMAAGASVMQGGEPPPEEVGASQGAGADGYGIIQAPQGGSPGQTISGMVSMQQEDVPIDQLQSDAMEAAQLIITMPVGVERNRLYAQIKAGNPSLHALVKQMVSQMENSAAQKGVEMQRAGELPE